MLFDKLKREKWHTYEVPKRDPGLDQPLSPTLEDTLARLAQLTGQTADLQVNRLEVEGYKLAFVMFEGLVNYQTLILGTASDLHRLLAGQKIPSCLVPDRLCQELFMAGDKKKLRSFEELIQFIASGFAVLLIDGSPEGVALGVQGFSFRSIGEPASENNLRGSREGFAEPIRINMSMIRRRMKTPSLRMKLLKVGEKSRTDVCLIYRSDYADPEMVRRVEQRLREVRLDNLMDSGYLRPFLESGPFSLFSGTGVTERPDTLCAKVSEGRIAILVDGSPYAILLPCLFSENFQSMDDYAERPYYAVFIRLIKYLAFFLTILLPGCYVAAVNFHPELIPDQLLFRIAEAEQGMAFPLMFQALLIHFIYELMREAGLRLPRPVGHAVSIIGALVIGDAAVTAGLISTPMVMVVALTTISSFVIPSLYEPVTLLRLLFILLGGTLGLYGVVLGLAFVGVNLCSVTVLGVPATSPETPLSLYSLRDTLIRVGWRQLGQEQFIISRTAGADQNGEPADQNGEGQP